MSLEIGNLKITTWKPSVLQEALEAVKQLPTLPVSSTVKTDPSKTVTVLERENACVVVTPEIDSVATLDCRWCVFVVLRGKHKDGREMVLAHHADDATDIDDKFMECRWERHVSQWDHQHPIEVWLVGGEHKKNSSRVIKNIIKNLVALFLREKVNIRITKQCVLESFQFRVEDYMRLCADYMLMKASAAYEKLFGKPFPAELHELSFEAAIPDPKKYKSVVPGFEEDLLRCRLEVLRIVSSEQESWDSMNDFAGRNKIPLLDKYKDNFMEMLPGGVTNWLLFCQFLYSADRYDSYSKTFFQMQTIAQAGLFMGKSGEEMFIWRLKRWFSLPLGYDAARWLTICSGINQAIKYSQFAVSLQEGTICPVTNRFHDIPYYGLRIGRLLDSREGIQVVNCCDLRGQMAEPKLSAAFLNTCDKYKSCFVIGQTDPDKAIDLPRLKQISAEMGLPHYAWDMFVRFMRDYANPPKVLGRAPAPAAQNPARLEAALINNLTPEKVAPKKAPQEKSTRSPLKGGWYK